MSYILEVNKLILKLNIGVEAEERLIAQEIECSLVIKFAKIPPSCASDHIKDTLCYASLVEALEKFCQDREFHLIEHLGFLLYRYLKDNILELGDHLSVRICKSPPIAAIKGNCCFIIADDVLKLMLSPAN